MMDQFLQRSEVFLIHAIDVTFILQVLAIANLLTFKDRGKILQKQSC